MNMQEFEERTGFYPTQELYTAIETEYALSKLDKDAFCKMYKANKNGIAESTARRVSISCIIERDRRDTETAAQIIKLEDEVARLKRLVELEQEWKPEKDTWNVTQEQYDMVANVKDAQPMTEAEAIDFIATEFGFSSDKIKLVQEVPVYEVNRHGLLRRCGSAARLPFNHSTDWNYVRFDCACMGYEVLNGELRLFRS